MRRVIFALVAAAIGLAVSWQTPSPALAEEPVRPDFFAAAVYNVTGPATMDADGEPVDVTTAIVWWDVASRMGRDLTVSAAPTLHIVWPLPGDVAAHWEMSLAGEPMVRSAMQWIDPPSSTATIGPLEQALPVDEATRWKTVSTLQPGKGPCFPSPMTVGDYSCRPITQSRALGVVFPTNIEDQMPWPGSADGVESSWSLVGIGNATAAPDEPDTGWLGLPATPRPTARWGPNDRNLEHSLPLGPTLDRLVLESNPVAQFVSQHADAYVAQAKFSSYYDYEGSEHLEWEIQLHDGTDQAWFRISLEPPGLADRVVPVPALAQISVEQIPGSNMGAPPRPPTAVAPNDLFVRYKAIQGSDATSYGWSVQCSDQCNEGHYIVEVGRRESRWPQTSLLGLQHTLTQKRDVTDILAFDEAGLSSWRTTRDVTAPWTTTLLSNPTPPKPTVAGVAEPASNAPAMVTASVVLLAILLLKKSLWASLFSRVPHGALLDNPRRQQILATIESNPGIHFREIARRNAVGRGALGHHIRKMEAAGIISSKPGLGVVLYFPGNPGRKQAEMAVALKADTAQQIVNQLRRRPAESGRELARILGLAPSTAATHLKRLQAAGIVAYGEGGKITLLETVDA